MAKRSDDRDWREQVIRSLPTMEANTGPGATGFQPAAAADIGPLTFHGSRMPDDPAELLDGLPLVKMTLLHQRALDLRAQIPTHEEVQEQRLVAVRLKNRIADLTRHRSDGGPSLSNDAPQVAAVRKQMERAEQEAARLTELKEVRAARWSATAQLDQAVSDWVLRGIPSGCVIEPIEDDPPIAELLKKGETIANAVERYRHRKRELAADAHRVNSAPWPISQAEVDANELIERRADAAAPNPDGAIEHGGQIAFATTRLSGLVHNAQPGVVAFIEAEDAVGLVCWLFRKELLAKISTGFREIGDDTNALDQRQREEMLATISADSLIAERAEVALIWHAVERGGVVIDFRSTTTPHSVLGVALRTLPHADPPSSSPERAGYNLIGGRR